MMLNIKKKQDGVGICYVLSGELDMATGNHLEELMEREDFYGIKKISFCLSELEFIDSTGIGQLIKYYRQYTSNNIAVGIINDNPEIEEVLEIIGLREIMANN
jgi:anti-anti-sigma factor